MTATTTEPTAARLTAVRRARVLARRGLFAGLRAVPGSAVTAIHDRWVDDDGTQHPSWRPLAAVLFYRPVPLDAFTVPGGRGERLTVAGTRIERRLWWYGEAGYENGEAGWWRRLCERSSNVLEIGANIGYYSVVGALATRGSYTTVEANPEAGAVVRANLDLNGLEDVELVRAAAVGPGAPAELELAFPDQEQHSVAPLGSYLREGTESVADRAATRSVMVPTVDAGSLFAGRDLVKLDIEGSEAAVIEGAREQIRASRPVMLVELLAESSRLRRVMTELVERDGYRVALPGPALTPVPAEDLGAIGDRDVVLVPRGRDDVV